jgi:hypothetical protein
VRRASPAVTAALVAALAIQIALSAFSHGQPERSRETLAPAPRVEVLRLASLGEDAAAARLVMLYLQGFDLRGLDYRRLTGWLGDALALDPRSAYPLFAAARVFAETPDPAASRLALDFVYREFSRDPDRRWQWLAHAALLAKHRLKDLPLARRYAAAVRRDTSPGVVPAWARDLEAFILEDMNELEAAKIVLGGLLEHGDLHDPNERRFLRQKLQELEKRVK